MKILHLEDNPADAELVRSLVAETVADCETVVVETREAYLAELIRGGYDVILSDYSLPNFDGMEALKLAGIHRPDTPFIFFSGSLGEDKAIAALHAGAIDYVLKDGIKRLCPALERAMRDAAERAARRETQERYRRLIEHARDAIFTLDHEGRITSLNPAFTALTGWPQERWLGQTFPGLVHPDDLPGALDVFARVLLGERPPHFELRVTTADGTYIDFEFTLTPMEEKGRRALLGIGRDVTERKRALARIHEQAEVINKAPIAIIITDLGHRVTYCNEGAQRLYGFTEEQLLNRRADELFSAETMRHLSPGRDAALATGAWRGEVPITTPDGRQIIVEFSMNLIRDGTGQPKGRLSVGLDITEKKKLAEQFLRAQRMESIGMLASGIAHDLNNVLAPILMTAPLLREHLSSPEDLHILRNLEKSAERGAALVRQILGFIQGVTGEVRPIQIKHLVRDIADVSNETFPKSIVIENNTPGDLWLVQANPSQIHQVLLNLCVNARDAMPAGGKLIITARNLRTADDDAQLPGSLRPGAYVVISVSDTGTGILPEVLEKIWDPFFTTKAPTKGTGLGLSTTRGIVESLGGTITLDTAVGRGTTFTVYLPALEADPTRDSDQPFAIAPTGSNELILVVDDEAHIRDVASATLIQFGYRVLSAPDGIDAVQLYAARATDIALVITDLNMPNLDGFGFAQVIRQMKPDAKIIVSSGLGSSHHVNDARQLCDGFLQKPFTVEELLEQVYRVLHPRHNG